MRRLALRFASLLGLLLGWQKWLRLASITAIVALLAAGRWAMGCSDPEQSHGPQLRTATELLVGSSSGPATPLPKSTHAQSLADHLYDQCSPTTNKLTPDAGLEAGAAPTPALEAGQSEAGGSAAPSPSVPIDFEAAGSSVRVSGSAPGMAHAAFATTANGGFALEDEKAAMRLRISLNGASTAAPEAAAERLVYSDVLPSAVWTVAPHPGGVEDTLRFAQAPQGEEVVYGIDLDGVAGVRFVDGNLEFLDSTGDPRLRMARPWLYDGNCSLVDADVTLTSCTASTDPSPPWGKTVTAPGSTHCDLHISWAGRGAKYPLTVDPSWIYGTNQPYTYGISIYHSGAALLNNTYAFVSGGHYYNTTNSQQGTLASAAFYNAGTNTWSSTTPIGGGTGANEDRYMHTATTLQDGSVLVLGGRASDDVTQRLNAWIFNGSTWTQAGSIPSGRSAHTTTLLSDGRVFVAGGQIINGTFQNSVLLWSPSTPTVWSAPNPMAKARWYHTATRMADGRVLIAGGWNDTDQWLTGVEIFDPSQGTLGSG